MPHKLPHLAHPKYRPDIDGLRAVAILSVVGFHAFPGKLAGGFIGVDIFFVISGFLISTIIFSSLERERFSLVEFYIRRIRRIFPALILVLAACLALGWYVLLVDEYKQLGKHTAAGSGFIQNFILYRESGYFDNDAETKPLLHLWSLAIEEQFYIFWPLLLAFVWKRNWSFLRITFVIAAVSFSANIYLMHRDQTAAFYIPISRFWELMIGGVLAYAVLHRPQLIASRKNSQSTLGFLLILLGLLLLNKAREFPGWWAILPTLGAFFIISAGPRAWLNEKLLSNKVVVWIGLISYPLYLWHWPLLSFAQIMESGNASREIKLAAIALTFVLAWLTFQFFEKPLRFGKRKGLVAVLLSFLMLMFLAAGVAVNNGLLSPRNNDAALSPIVTAINDWGYPGNLRQYIYQGEVFNYVAGGSGRITMMMGDSHIEQYGPRVLRLSRDLPSKINSVYFSTVAACPQIPFIEYANSAECNRHIQSTLDFIKAKNVSAVVIGACWNCYFNERGYKMRNTPNSDGYSYVKNGRREKFADGSGKDSALKELELFLKELSKITKVYLILDNPIAHQQDPETFIDGSRLSTLRGNSVSQVLEIPAEQFALRSRLVDIANRSAVEVMDPFSILCPSDKGACLRMTADRKPIYKDSNHLRPFFVRENVDYLDKALLAR